MQVTGVQPVGGSRYVALQPGVGTERPPAPPTSAETEPARATQAARLPEAETVVLPRRRKSVDQRPAALKHARVTAKYKENARASK